MPSSRPALVAALALVGCASHAAAPAPATTPAVASAPAATPATPAGSVAVAPTLPPSDAGAGPPASAASATSADGGAPDGGGTVGEALALQANLLMVETVVGTGKEVKEGDHVTVHIVGTLKDGTVFDDSRKRKKPLQFVAGGDGAVVKGLSEGVIGMKVGGHRALTVPPALGYGNKKGAKAPPGSTLQFDVELLSVK